MTHHILIDGSYFIFYRYFALLQWWKLSHKDEPLTSHPIHNTEFVDKFRVTFSAKIREITKKLKITEPVKLIVAQDCPRCDIWRNELLSSYKGTRPAYQTLDLKNPGPFFKLVYKDKLFEEAGVSQVLKHERLEADDVIAITTEFILDKSAESNITIITSDTDYLQLICPNTQIVNLKYAHVQTDKNSLMCPEKDLLCKIIMGDKSDNILPIFPKCGRKTAIKYVMHPEMLLEKLSNPLVKKQFELNKILIDFINIPSQFRDEMRCKLSSLSII